MPCHDLHFHTGPEREIACARPAGHPGRHEGYWDGTTWYWEGEGQPQHRGITDLELDAAMERAEANHLISALSIIRTLDHDAQAKYYHAIREALRDVLAAARSV